jgi:hypothetical protein
MHALIIPNRQQLFPAWRKHQGITRRHPPTRGEHHRRIKQIQTGFLSEDCGRLRNTQQDDGSDQSYEPSPHNSALVNTRSDYSTIHSTLHPGQYDFP